MIRSPIRRWSSIAAVGVPALLFLVACGAGPNVDAGSDDGDMAQLMFDADWALEGTAEGLLGAGYEFGRLTAHFASCDEQAYQYVYQTSVRAADGAAFTPPEVEVLRAELASAGWEDVDPEPSDSVADSGWPITSSQFEFAEISLVVDAPDEASDDTAAMTMATECAEATDREIEFFEAMGEWEPVRRLPTSSVPATTG